METGGQEVREHAGPGPLQCTCRLAGHRFATPAEYARLLSEKPAFARLAADRLELFARTTLRPASDGDGYEPGCPREHEARLWDSLYPFARRVDFAAMACPVKVIGSDPTVFNSFLPSLEMPDLMLLDYDFVPETTHLMQLEEPETCAELTLECLAGFGIATA